MSKLTVFFERSLLFLRFAGSLTCCFKAAILICGAKLCGAELCGAELCGAELCGAELCGAELCGAV